VAIQRKAGEYPFGSLVRIRERDWVVLPSDDTDILCLRPLSGSESEICGIHRQRRGKAKQPYCFEVNEGELFAFAGLWDRWRDQSGQWLKSCSILTTTPNAVTSAVHDRMPVILNPDSYDLSLDPGMTNVEAVSKMLKPFDARLMTEPEGERVRP
jgi:hypothetical protein